MSKLSLSHEERIKWLAATLARELNKSVKNNMYMSHAMIIQTDDDIYDKPTVLEH